MATPISNMTCAGGAEHFSSAMRTPRASAVLWCAVRGWIVALAACFVLPTSLVGSEADAAESFSRQAREDYLAAQEEFNANPSSEDAALQMARAAFNWAGHQRNDQTKAKIAEEGIAASRKLLELAPKSAAAHYYLGMNQGRLAQTKTLGALKLVGQMEAEFQRARDLDENYSFGGPDRNLGLLYRDAPGWPASIGSRSKAREHLQRAVELAPDYPENRLNLIEAHLKWGDTKAAREGVEALDEIWEDAREKFSGPEWAPDWADWQARRTEAKDRAQRRSPPLHIQRGAK